MTTASGRGGQPARRGRPPKQSTARRSSTKQATTKQSAAKQPTTRGRATKQTASKQSTTPARQASRSTAAQTRSATVQLPFVSAQFRAPDVHLPGRQEVASAANSVRPYLPPRDQALFYGALTLGAVFTVIEWPVALAIGLGTAVVSRGSTSPAR